MVDGARPGSGAPGCEVFGLMAEAKDFEEATGTPSAEPTVGTQPATFDDLCNRSGRTPAQVSVALARLQAGGWVAERAGWWERDGA